MTLIKLFMVLKNVKGDGKNIQIYGMTLTDNWIVYALEFFFSFFFQMFDIAIFFNRLTVQK